jgi:hypothetical protein
MSAPTAAPVVPERYVQALGDRDALNAMRKAPRRLKKLLKGLSKKEVLWRPAPGQWSIHEVVAHLADGEVILGARLRFVAAMDVPPLPGYDQDLFVARLGIDKVDLRELFDAFESMRALNVGLIERLPKDALQRTGMHAERGPESIQTMLSMYAGHDRIHEQQIERILAAREAAEAARKDGKSKRKAEKKAAKALAKAGKVRTKKVKAAEKATETDLVPAAKKAERKPEPALAR